MATIIKVEAIELHEVYVGAPAEKKPINYIDVEAILGLLKMIFKEHMTEGREASQNAVNDIFNALRKFGSTAVQRGLKVFVVGMHVLNVLKMERPNAINLANFTGDEMREIVRLENKFAALRMLDSSCVLMQSATDAIDFI